MCIRYQPPLTTPITLREFITAHIMSILALLKIYPRTLQGELRLVMIPFNDDFQTQCWLIRLRLTTTTQESSTFANANVTSRWASFKFGFPVQLVMLTIQIHESFGTLEVGSLNRTKILGLIPIAVYQTPFSRKSYARNLW